MNDESRESKSPKHNNKTLKKIHSKVVLGVICSSLMIASCGRQPITPKPMGYFRIALPEKSYLSYQSECDFKFEYPAYAKIVKDVRPNAEPCWYNIEFPALKATIHCSYKTGADEMNQFVEDSRSLVYKHTVKADAIEETVINDSVHNVYGVLYDIKGNAASSVQFFLTDSTDKFLRGALYFNVAPNKDSLAPVLTFVRADIDQFIKTFTWK